MTFFDLGVRKIDGEWSYPLTAFPFNDADPEAHVAAWNDAFLSDLDPFPKCLPLGEHAENLYVDLIFGEGEGEKRYIVGKGSQRGYLIDYPVDAPGDEPASRDNPWRASSLSPKFEDARAVRLESAWFYNSFDTAADSLNYKVTASPDPTADAVSLTFRASERVAFYLTPKAGAYFRALGDAVLVRAPVLMAPDVYAEQFASIYRVSGDAANALIYGRAPAAVWSALTSLVRDAGVSEGMWPADSVSVEALDVGWYISSTAHPPLVGIVKRGDSLYYVWAIMGDPTGDTLLPFRQPQIINPHE